MRAHGNKQRLLTQRKIAWKPLQEKTVRVRLHQSSTLDFTFKHQ